MLVKGNWDVMVTDALVRPLLRVALFQGLNPSQLQKIARRAERIVYQPGDILIEEGAQGDAAILMVTGLAVRVSGPELRQQAELVTAGSLLGEMTMLIETDHSSTVIARSPVRALRLVRAELQAQMAEDDDLATHFVDKIAKRLSQLGHELRAIDSSLARQTEDILPSAAVIAGDAIGREMVLH